MNLSYQIVNLQMLLDRALSDRIYPQGSSGGTRLQTVLGFNVSLDPPRTANDNRARDAWYGLSMGLAKPQLFSHAGYQNYREYGTVRVGATGEYQRQLTPIVTRIEWRPTGAKTTTISVKGNNFFTDTQVLLGDTKYSEAAGNMAIKSDQSFELASTLDQVASGTGVIEGRYGLSTPLVNAGPVNCVDTCAYGVEIDPGHAPEITQAMGGSRRLTVTLRAIPSPEELAAAGADDKAKAALLKLSVSKIAGLSSISLTGDSPGSGFRTTQTPVLSVNGTAIPFPYDIVSPIFSARYPILAARVRPFDRLQITESSQVSSPQFPSLLRLGRLKNTPRRLSGDLPNVTGSVVPD